MTHLTFDEWACRNTQAKLDSYIDNELLVETNLEMTQHFERCRDCAREAEVRRELRERVKTAVRSTSVPTGLDARVRERLRHPAGARPARWNLIAIAALILVCFGSWLAYERGGRPVPPQLAALLRVATGDHVHCAVIRQSIARPVGQDKLSPQYKPLLAIAREHVPTELALAVAHECHYLGRRFVHMTFRNERRLLSIVIARRQDGESLSGAGAWPAMSQSGTALYAGSIDHFQAAAFESGGFLVYTVSDLPPAQNLRLLAAMAPAIRTALGRSV